MFFECLESEPSVAEFVVVVENESGAVVILESARDECVHLLLAVRFLVGLAVLWLALIGGGLLGELLGPRFPGWGVLGGDLLRGDVRVGVLETFPRPMVLPAEAAGILGRFATSKILAGIGGGLKGACLLYTSPSPRDS